ncbi:MAG: hypothetical protein JW904_01245 [Spirochaetales bacterium]|nr:hypothetical protein [Spirochaetales bacterium]
MKKKLWISMLFLAVCIAASPAQENTKPNQEFLPRNTWVELTSDSIKTRYPGYKFDGERYYKIIPVLLQKGGRYTLIAEWDDGKAMLIMVRGHSPQGKVANPPDGTLSQAVINISGGKDRRINFTVDPKSAGTTAWIVFPALAPNRKVRIILKSPADPDKVTEAVVKGRIIGSVYKTPLYLFDF